MAEGSTAKTASKKRASEKLTKTKETKNTVKYDNADSDVLTAIYIQKSAAEILGNPDSITVSISA